MADLPAWALAIIVFVVLASALSLLNILARAAQNEVEVHALRIRVTRLKAEYDRTLRALRGEIDEEGEFDIIEDEPAQTTAETTSGTPIESLVAEGGPSGQVEAAPPEAETGEPQRMAA